MRDRIRLLRVVRPDERASWPRTERQILADLRSSALEFRRALAAYDQGLAEWAEYLATEMGETG